jgi:hypothetical protein
VTRREGLLVVAVVVPVALLAWLSLADREAVAPAPTALTSAARPGATARADLSPPRPRSPDAGAAPPPGAPDAGPRWPRELAAPLAAVTPEVLRCIDDQRAHLGGALRLEVRFRPLPDGGFSEVQVASTQNPYIAACVEDVFAELGYVPGGDETFARATHVFEFDPASR